MRREKHPAAVQCPPQAARLGRLDTGSEGKSGQDLLCPQRRARVTDGQDLEGRGVSAGGHLEEKPGPDGGTPSSELGPGPRRFSEIRGLSARLPPLSFLCSLSLGHTLSPQLSRAVLGPRHTPASRRRKALGPALRVSLSSRSRRSQLRLKALGGEQRSPRSRLPVPGDPSPSPGSYFSLSDLLGWVSSLPSELGLSRGLGGHGADVLMRP